MQTLLTKESWLAPNVLPWEPPSDPNLLDAWTEVTPRQHRDLKDIPTDKLERRDKVRWVLEHPLFYYDVEIPDMSFEDTEDSRYKKAVFTHTDVIKRIGGGFDKNAWFDYVYVNPHTEYIEDEDNDHLNTDFRVWIECGGWCDQSLDGSSGGYVPKEGWDDYNKWIPIHDCNLDCGGKDMEEALLRLAMLVEFYYNNDGSHKTEAPICCEGYLTEDDEYKSGCERGPDGFCVKCGYLVRPETPERIEKRKQHGEMLRELEELKNE
jgi:hypothetical protein